MFYIHANRTSKFLFVVPELGISSFLKDFILFMFRERGREGEREGEKHPCERLVADPHPGTHTCAMTRS